MELQLQIVSADGRGGQSITCCLLIQFESNQIGSLCWEKNQEVSGDGLCLDVSLMCAEGKRAWLSESRRYHPPMSWNYQSCVPKEFGTVLLST